MMLDDQRMGYARKSRKSNGKFKRLGQIPGVVVKLPKLNTIIEKRVIDTAGLLAESDEKQPVTFQHTILCQTCLPYRDPGDDVRVWERLNGDAHLEVLAGKAMHPEQGRLVPLGLPFGPKPRLVLAHVNAEALRKDSPEIEMRRALPPS
jgi:hypothetical protein